MNVRTGNLFTDKRSILELDSNMMKSMAEVILIAYLTDETGQSDKATTLKEAATI